MALSPLEQFEFGGIDSRSNPLNFPRNRSLRMKNFAPQDSGVLQLRYGFSTVTMSTVSATAFHDLVPLAVFDASGTETDYLILGQGTGTFDVLNIGTGTVSTPTMRGTSFASTSRGSAYHANNRIHFGNGTDQKWFDGSTYRNNGIRAMTTSDVSSVVMVAGVLELTSAERSSVSVTTTASGSFATTTLGGIFFYISAFDTTVNELGPATEPAPSSRVSFASSGLKASFSGLPAVVSTQVKLISRTVDGGADAYFCTDTSTSATLARSSTTITFTATSHGLTTGDVVMMSGATDDKYNQPWSVTVSDANTFTATIFSNEANFSATDSGTVKRIISVAAATTTKDVTGTATDTSFVVNQDWGLAATSTTLADPGYQFYASIYNRTGGAHVGTRIAFGGRFTTTTRCNLKIANLPDLTGTDSEWEILLGRTGDGGQVPYVVTDNDGNWISLNSGQVAYYNLTRAAVDATKEMPSRNGVVPSTSNIFVKVGDKVHAVTSGRPYVYISLSGVDLADPDNVGRPEQSFPSDNLETFPTGQGIQGGFEVEGEAFYGTKNDGAILSDVTGVNLWRGPWWGAGIAGIDAHCDSPYGHFWVTGHKQLATIVDGVPTPISDEYEAALLSQIGDANLDQTQMEHIRDVSKRIDQLLIKCLDSNGNPFVVIHDFRLRDDRSPHGQGYEADYSSPLSSDFILTRVRDSSGAERLWAGASTGQLYQLHTGATDGGTEYSADAIFIVNGGPERPSLPEIQLFGDSKATVSIGHSLNSTISTGASTDMEPLTPDGLREVDVNNFHYSADNSKDEASFIYLRLQLTSHSADGNLDLNSPPHVPVENYGRVYLVRGLMGLQRGPA